MKLFTLKEKDNAPRDEKNTIGGYDTYDSFVIRAKNEKEAREIASEFCSDANCELWKDPIYTECKELFYSGEGGVIISSYNAG